MLIVNNFVMLCKYYFSYSQLKIDYELSEEDKKELYDPDFYCGCACCYLCEQCGLFISRPLKVL